MKNEPARRADVNRLFRAGEAAASGCPTKCTKAVRDLVRGRTTTTEMLVASASNCCRSCCGMAGSSPAGITGPVRIGAGWPSFDHPAQQIVFRTRSHLSRMLSSGGSAGSRAVNALSPKWSMAPVIAAYQAMRGVSFLVAVTFAAEIGDVAPLRYSAPTMAFPRIGPCRALNRWTVRRTGLTLAGNRRPVGCWWKQPGVIAIPLASAKTLQFASKHCQRRSATSPGRPGQVVAAATVGSTPLAKLPVIIAAIAREMAAFLQWAIGRQITPAPGHLSDPIPIPAAQRWGWNNGGNSRR